MKKLIISLGTTAAIIAPIVSVVACGHGAGSNPSDKNTGTDNGVKQVNNGTQADHNYPILLDGLRSELQNSTADALNFFKLKGKETYFDQFKQFANDKANYIVFFQNSKTAWFVAPYHEVYDYFHSLAPQKFSYLNN